MTEEECLASEDPAALFLFAGKATSARKWRLFAVACCYRVRERFRFEWELVESAEQLADGLGSVQQAARELRNLSEGDIWLEDIKAAWHAAWVGEWAPWEVGGSNRTSDEPSSDPASYHFGEAETTAGYCAAMSCDDEYKNGEGVHKCAQFQAERVAQLSLIRDIFGDLSRPTTFAPEWRTDTATAIAQQMYESRDFGAMPILADALQDAGCDSADVLDHCRGPGPHVRGCWVVDLVLGKE